MEQLWRDNRLNMIHEGTHGIQALDLLGRNVLMDDGAAFALLGERVTATIGRVRPQEGLARLAGSLEAAFEKLRGATQAAWATGIPDEALANATPYLQAFGHFVIAWIWLDVAVTASRVRNERGTANGSEYLRGKLQATRYFFDYELPKIDAWLKVVEVRNSTCREMKDEWFSE